MITHVVFDFDGTLADSKEAAIKLYNELAEKNGYGLLTADNLAKMRELSIFDRCKQLGVAPYKLPWLVVQLTRNFRQAMQSIEFNEGIPELLKELRARGLKLMILSSNDEGNIRAFLRRHSAEEWVDEIYCSSSIFGKARLLRALMKRAGLTPDQLVYVGDEHRDVQACKEVGVRIIAVRWGVDADVRLREAGPNHIADRPAEIAECVSRWSTAA
ncbi:HAD-IA family hydrolase [Archangium minus]|uniref:HAD-IA family hydrolase n=1 Tax=Archangium minus TaxID=83450 RepID=A0ABY9WUV4_9BACT|nr:HAD-IA family hydrolase [Archangium violaceum]WNG46425.1 HAD-IA family hydrolase [Archangium minus]